MSTDKKTLLELMDETAPLEAGVVAWDDGGPGVSEAQVAEALGLSVLEVRRLIRRFGLDEDPKPSKAAQRYRPGVIETLRRHMGAVSSGDERPSRRGSDEGAGKRSA